MTNADDAVLNSLFPSMRVQAWDPFDEVNDAEGAEDAERRAANNEIEAMARRAHRQKITEKQY